MNLVKREMILILFCVELPYHATLIWEEEKEVESFVWKGSVSCPQLIFEMPTKTITKITKNPFFQGIQRLRRQHRGHIPGTLEGDRQWDVSRPEARPRNLLASKGQPDGHQGRGASRRPLRQVRVHKHVRRRLRTALRRGGAAEQLASYSWSRRYFR